MADEKLPGGLYSRLLGEAWPGLDAAARHMHRGAAVVRGAGVFRIRHGTSLLARTILRMLRMPPPADAMQVHLEITREGDGERWMRQFGAQPLESTQREGAGGLLVEQIGPLEFRFRLAVDGGALCYRAAGTSTRLGGVRMRLPGFLAPQVVAREAPGGSDRVCVEVSVRAPGAGLLIAYDGWLRIEEQPR